MQPDETMNVDGVRIRVKITEQAKKQVAEFTFEATIDKPLEDLTEEDIGGYLQAGMWVRDGL